MLVLFFYVHVTSFSGDGSEFVQRFPVLPAAGVFQSQLLKSFPESGTDPDAVRKLEFFMIDWFLLALLLLVCLSY